MKTFGEFRERRVVILRGISGAGKSTYIKRSLPHSFAVSADHYFQRGGAYDFDAAKLPKAHGQSLWRFRSAVDGVAPLIVVDNTNTRVREMEPYISYAKEHGYSVEVVRLMVDPEVAAKRNVHNVPAEVVRDMQQRFEDYPGEKIVKASLPVA